ncbi:hypothetical protein PR003_g11567 [Phytophthora rubi]|uniref:Uncharacterized protein n=1 Tax=Phytophthora rubi TaxID=129364 RepID=A0A6A4FL00_9STRA|nr:hypothetical protein PR003_g11567 [Phytophthora rubi]
MRQHRSHRDGRLSTSKKLLPEPVDEEVAASVLLLFEVDDAILPMVSVSVDDVSDCTYTENVYAIDPLVSLVTALRLARSSEQSNEPYAWASRVHLRRLCVGKQVRFQVEYRVAAINCDFGSVWLAPNVRGVEENMCVIQARTGYAKVKTPEQSRDGACVDVEKMLQQEQVAISEKKCMYADADAESNATVQWHGADTAALVSE